MNAAEFRRLALRLPETAEGAHQGHPDFRVGGKVFASLGPDDAWAMVKVAAETQARLVRDEPDACEPFAGAWGRQGCTKVRLERVRSSTVKAALADAWHNVAPAKLVRERGDEVR